MKNTLINEFYSKLVSQHIQSEKYMDACRNLSVFIIAGMMYFIFGFPETSSHLVAILGSVTIFVLQVFHSREYGKNISLKRKMAHIEEQILKQNADSINADTISQSKPPGFLYSLAATTYKDYIIIFLTLDVCWLAKLYLFPTTAGSWTEFLNRPEFGALPGWFFFLFAGGFWTLLISLAIWYKKKSKTVEAGI